jgi:hypothetical protein
MPLKPNYNHAKRQRDLAKKAKQAAKQQKKADARDKPDGSGADSPSS